jgi:hypothetical protein
LLLSRELLSRFRLSTRELCALACDLLQAARRRDQSNADHSDSSSFAKMMVRLSRFARRNMSEGCLLLSLSSRFSVGLSPLSHSASLALVVVDRGRDCDPLLQEISPPCARFVARFALALSHRARDAVGSRPEINHVSSPPTMLDVHASPPASALVRQALKTIALGRDFPTGVVEGTAGITSRYGLVKRPSIAPLIRVMRLRSTFVPRLPHDDGNENDVERRHALTIPPTSPVSRTRRPDTSARARAR